VRAQPKHGKDRRHGFEQSQLADLTNEHLLAVALPGTRDAVPSEHRNIIANKDPVFSRPRSLAVVNANDVIVRSKHHHLDQDGQHINRRAEAGFA
jgi:hypothetical protein